MTEFLTEYALYFLLALGVSVCAAWLVAERSLLPVKTGTLFLFLLIYAAFGLLSVKLFPLIEAGFDTAKANHRNLFGAEFFLPVAFWITAKWAKISKKDLFDVFTPCVLLVMLCGCINCIFAGCCKGVFIPGTSFRFPTREAEILFYAIMLLFLCPRILKNKTNGTAYPLYMLSYGVFRFIIEFFRESDTQTLFHISHAWALLSAVLGVAIYSELQLEKSNSQKHKKHRERN